jgi:hypothetical protein
MPVTISFVCILRDMAHIGHDGDVEQLLNLLCKILSLISIDHRCTANEEA